MPKMVRKPRRKGDIGELDARLWRLFRLIEAQAHESKDSGDAEGLRKDAHAAAALSAQIRSSHEVNDQEKRIKQLEAQIENRLRKVV